MPQPAELQALNRDSEQTHGALGLKILALLPGGDAAFPNVQVEIGDAHEVCSGALVPFVDAPIESE